MAEYNELYQRAIYYDIVFARDAGPEADCALAAERFLFAQEIRLLAALSGALEPAGRYGDYDLRRPLDISADSKWMIVVLQKRM
jgi:hypothetical protein